MSLTERTIRDAKPGPKTQIFWDSVLKGFGVRVTPAGAKSYVVDYRIDGRQRRATVARCSEMSVKDARQRAGEVLTAAREGVDPLAAREQRRTAPTVNDLVDEYFERRAPARMADGRLAPRTVADYRAQTKRTVRPALGKLRVEAVARRDVEAAVAKLGKVQRNRTLAFLSMLFNYAESLEWRGQHTNPCRHVERSREQPRDRVLSPTEIQEIAGALDALGEPVAAGAIKFLALTGWRTGEALGLKWEHLDLETGRVTLPSTKTGRDTRTLAGLALQLVKAMPRRSNNPHVFPWRGRKPLPYHQVHRRFADACEAAGVADVRLHDLRRTVATNAAAAGLSVFLLRDLLNHKTVAMANRYARQAGSALQHAQDEAAERMAGMMAGASGEVVELPGVNRNPRN